jgi:hypothetical protein
LREQRSSHTARYSQPPCWGKYVMPPTQAWVGAAGAGWPGKRLGAARTAGSESVVRGANERGCWARRPWAWSTRRMRQRPARWPSACTSARSRRVPYRCCGAQTPHARPLVGPVAEPVGPAAGARRSTRWARPAGRGRQDVAELAHRCLAGPPGDALVHARGVGWAKRAKAFFKLSRSCARRLWAARRARTSGPRAASTWPASATNCACRQRWSRLGLMPSGYDPTRGPRLARPGFPKPGAGPRPQTPRRVCVVARATTRFFGPS